MAANNNVVAIAGGANNGAVVPGRHRGHLGTLPEYAGRRGQGADRQAVGPGDEGDPLACHPVFDIDVYVGRFDV